MKKNVFFSLLFNFFYLSLHFINTEIDEYYTAGSGEKFVTEIPQGEEDFFMVQGYVNVRKKVKVKSK